MGTLDHKIALVTGASKGIGASIAKHLAAAGAYVVINYASSKSGAEKTLQDITAAGGKASILQGDFSNPHDIASTFSHIERTHGKLDVLVNNAGVYAFGPVEEVVPEEFHRQFNLNVLGLLLAIKHASPLMSNGGSIINIGSLVGAMAQPYASVYSATKGAVDSLTVSLSKELGPRNIRVNSLNPGIVATEGAQTLGVLEGDFHDEAVKRTPLGRIAQPDDIGPIAVFLASPAAQWVTGQQIVAAGGYTS